MPRHSHVISRWITNPNTSYVIVIRHNAITDYCLEMITEDEIESSNDHAIKVK